MPPKKERPKKKKEGEKESKEGKEGAASGDLGDQLVAEGITLTFSQDSDKIQHRNVRDISVANLSLLYHGVPLLEDTEFTLNYGNRYGFIGRNGCGKSVFMRTIAARCFPIPDGIEIFHLKEEIEATDMTAKEAVMSVDVERSALEAEAEELNERMLVEGEENQEELMDRLTQVYERLDEMDATTAETRASTILSGLGFTPAKQNKRTREFSGGWRMRIALARALFIQPTLLLLDEPTNHLDMEAVVWLEDYLSKWNKILFLVSHSQDFLNNVCTHMVNVHRKKLVYYTGNYDTFVAARAELEQEQMKRYKWEQDEIQKMKDYVAKFGHGTAKNAKQAQSKEKTLEKMVRGGLTDKVEVEKSLDFTFADPGKLSPPVLQCNDITFGYPGCEILYSEVDFGVDLDSRVALVGPNGAGKSTLLKIMTGELQPLTGSVRPHSHLRFSKFTQHFIDVLDLSATPLEYFMSLWPDLTTQQARSFLGRFGITGTVQTQKMENLSDGQKSRVVLSKMAKENPHLLLLDEPTNHLDMESIDSLAKAINKFEGGVVLVSHDMRLISQVAKEIWMCDNKTVMRYQGEISDFKMQIQQQLEKDSLIQSSGKKKSFSTNTGPLLVPLGAPKKYGNEPTRTFTVAPPAAPVVSSTKDFPALSRPKTEEEEILAARLELAELAIQRQRARKAEKGEEKKSEAALTESEKAALAEQEAKKQREKEEREAREEELRLDMKAKKKAEKDAAAAYKAEQDALKEKRRLEMVADMEAAKKMQEDLEIARLERQRLREEKAAKEKKEEDDRLAAEQAEKDARRAEKQRVKREREEARQRQLAADKEAWMTAARLDAWTQEQQLCFERALLTAPLILETRGAETMEAEKKSRWNFIAAAVPGKNRNQCLLRYKLLLQVVADFRQIQASS